MGPVGCPQKACVGPVGARGSCGVACWDLGRPVEGLICSFSKSCGFEDSFTKVICFMTNYGGEKIQIVGPVGTCGDPVRGLWARGGRVVSLCCP